MNNKIKKGSLGGILALLAFTLFVASLLMVLLTGADVVKRLTDRDRENYDRMTATQYIATRVHQSDVDGMLSVGTFGEEIVPMEAFVAEDMGDHIRVTVSDGKREDTLYFSLRSRKEAN